MPQNSLTIEYGDDLLFRLGMSREKFASDAKLILAAKLYEMGKLSSGEAANFANKGRVEFLFALKDLGVPISSLQEENAVEELEFALDE
jgi:predicted HTH domain antitoxin